MDKTTCGTCGLSWDDSIVTGMTPVPSGRCPFEHFHREDDQPLKRADIPADYPVQPLLDMDARYSVDGYGGIAFYLRGYVMERDEDYEWSGIEYENREQVRAVMVGDDREHIVDVDDLTELDEDDYCPSCGQIGCPWH